MKQCTSCHQFQETTEFPLCTKGKNGLHSWCKSCKKQKYKAWYNKNKIARLAYKKAYTKANGAKISKQKAEYYQRNKTYIIQSITNRRRTNPKVRLITNLRNRLRKILRSNGLCKKSTTLQLLGCTATEWKQHLESQFLPRMTWKNYGKWHVDHIKPLSSFNLFDEKELKEAMNYQNTQPLWAKDNLSKGNKF
jgi:hypothetical protein